MSTLSTLSTDRLSLTHGRFTRLDRRNAPTTRPTRATGVPRWRCDGQDSQTARTTGQAGGLPAGQGIFGIPIRGAGDDRKDSRALRAGTGAAAPNTYSAKLAWAHGNGSGEHGARPSAGEVTPSGGGGETASR